MVFLLSTTIVTKWLVYSNRDTYVYFKNLDWGAAKLEELKRAFSLLVKLLKNGRNKIFHCHMCDSHFKTLSRQLPASDLTYYNREHKEKGKALVQMHPILPQYFRCLFTLLSIAPNTY